MPSTPYSIAMAPNGNFLAVSTASSGVYSFPITNGKLGTGVQVSQDQAYSVQIDTTSSWLVEAIPASGGVTLSAIPINTTTGVNTGNALAASFAVTSAALQQNRMIVSGDDKFVFVALGAGGTLVAPFNSNNPFPSGVNGISIPLVNSSGSALSVAVDPGTTPGLFYIGETLASGGTTGGVRAFNYSSLSGTLTQATGSPIASGGLAPNFILPVASPYYVYVANGAGTSTAGNITGFAITVSGSTYSIAAGGTVATGIQPLGLALDSTDAWVLEVGSSGSPYFDAYTFDSTTTGQLDSQVTSTTSSGAIAIVAAP